MTAIEFNIKWDDYIEPGFYGLEINDEKVIDFLDEVFSNFKYDFTISQIKLKFGKCRFYSTLDSNICSIIEIAIDNILKTD